MKLVHWPLMGGKIHLVQRGGAWAGCGPAQSPPRCTKSNITPINGQCINHCIAIWWSVALRFSCARQRVNLWCYRVCIATRTVICTMGKMERCTTGEMAATESNAIAHNSLTAASEVGQPGSAAGDSPLTAGLRRRGSWGWPVLVKRLYRLSEIAIFGVVRNSASSSHRQETHIKWRAIQPWILLGYYPRGPG